MKIDENYADTVLRIVESRRGIAVGKGRKTAPRTGQTENVSEKYNLGEITKKMQPYNRIYYSTFH
jgi:hypothetical protein